MTTQTQPTSGAMRALLYVLEVTGKGPALTKNLMPLECSPEQARSMAQLTADKTGRRVSLHTKYSVATLHDPNPVAMFNPSAELARHANPAK